MQCVITFKIHAAISFVKKLVESFSQSLTLENHSLPLKTSIGIVDAASAGQLHEGLAEGDAEVFVCRIRTGRLSANT